MVMLATVMLLSRSHVVPVDDNSQQKLKSPKTTMTLTRRSTFRRFQIVIRSLKPWRSTITLPSQSSRQVDSLPSGVVLHQRIGQRQPQQFALLSEEHKSVRSAGAPGNEGLVPLPSPVTWVGYKRETKTLPFMP